jgi:hypothetical protein
VTILLNGVASLTASPGTIVIVTGTGWAAHTVGASCTITGILSGLILSGYTCIFTTATTTSGSFTIGNVQGGTYTGGVIVTATTPAETAAAELIVDARITLSPAQGRQGQVITVTGAGFAPGAGACTITGSLLNSVAAYVCSVNGGLISAGSQFVVGSAVAGPSTIIVTFVADVPTAPFTVTAKPTLAVSPLTGGHGLSVSVSGTGFSGSDTSGVLTFTGGGALFSGSPTLTVTSSGPFKNFAGTFTVAVTATLGAPYMLTLTGNPIGDFANTTFTVAAADPAIVLTPAAGKAGDPIKVTTPVTPFSPTDAGICTISSIPTGLIASSVCQIDSSGNVVTPISGFVVASAAGGGYLVTVTGKLGDSASYPFTVTAGLTLTPNIGSPAAGSQVATEVTATGKGFRPGGPGGCTVTYGKPGGGTNGVLNIDTIGEPSCTVTSSGVLTFNFRVGAGSVWTALGYNVTVYGPLGDHASANFMVVPTIVLSPTSGSMGTHVDVVGSGFNGTAGSCSISGTLWTGTPSCVQSDDGRIVSYFDVNKTAVPGSYIITVKDALYSPYAYKTFSLGTGPSVTLSPSVVEGTVKTVTVTGSGWNTLDTSVSFNVTALSDPPYTRTCSVSGGSIASGCSFIVRLNARGGSYVIRFNGTQGDWTTAQFIVSSTLILTPTSGPTGTFVTMSGSGYTLDSSDCSGSVSASPALFASSPAMKCRIVNSVLSGNFTAALFTPATSYGTHTVTMTNLTLVQQGSVSASFTVIAPTISLSPTSGPRGILVTVSGVNFNLNDTTCTVIPTTCNTLGCSSCLVTSPGIISGIYAVNGTAGSQLVVARGYGPTIPAGTKNFDNATATFTTKAAITMLPTSGRAGTSVILTGTNFASADTGCTITSSPSGLITSPVCTLAGGSMSGAFIVASGTNGSYTVIVTGTTSDTGTATFNVPAPPTLQLTPSSGPVGSSVVASGSNYLGTTCLLTAVPSNLFASASCSLSGGTLSGGFTVASGASGSYTVTVQTNAGSGDSATTSFAVGGTATTAMTTSTTFTTATTTPTTTSTTTATTTVQTTSSVVSTATTVSTATGPWTPPKCVIATATFGSEASPAVQFLRNFRDKLVLSTTAGSAFMQVFNAWYYSFSPSVAQFIASNDPIRAPVRVLLYPLLGILGISALIHSWFAWAPEFGVLMAGLVASSLIGLTYFTAPALVGMQALLRKRRISAKILGKASLASLAIALTMLTVGEVAGSFLMLAIASSAVVLTCVIAVPVLVSVVILYPSPK